MVGLRRPRKRTTVSQQDETQPLVTPAQRILQRQWLQLSAPQAPPRVQLPQLPQLPQGTEIALVPSVAAKRPKTERKTAASGRATGDQGRGKSSLRNIRSFTVVPPLLSPLSSNHDGEVIHVEEYNINHDVEGIQVEDVGQSKPRDKMADPTPTKEAVVSTAHASSTRDAPSTTVAVVHAQADRAHEQRDESRQMDAPVVGDANEESRILSQELEDRRFAEMVDWKRKCCEKIAAVERNSAFLRQERETLLNRVREIDALLVGEDQSLEKWTNRLKAYQTLFTE